jgi:hypothetical protein
LAIRRLTLGRLAIAGPGRSCLLSGRRTGWLATGGTALQLLELLLEHTVAVLQFLVLTGEPPQLALQLLDPHRRIAAVVITLRE